MSLWETFAAALSDPPPDTEEARAELLRFVEDAERNSGATLPRETFVAFVAERVRRTPDGGVDLHGLHGGDLHLAAACVGNDAQALETFEARYGEEIDAGLARLDASQREELGQQIRARLMVGRQAEAPRIASYSGYGDLLHWLRVVVVRARTDALRTSARAVKRSAPAEALEAMGADGDLELDYLKQRYGAALKAAFEAAAGELEPRQRTLLRLQGVEGLTSQQIGALYGVHEATARRWIAAAREALLDATRAHLHARLDVGRADFESIVRLARSRLDLSIPRLLAGDDE